MKPEVTLIKREKATVEKRKPLTRVQFAQLLLDQDGRCGCGCGGRLDPMREGVVDEHILALGLTGSNELENRSIWRKPCSKAKTENRDIPAIAKAKRIAKVEEHGLPPGKIKGRGFDKTRSRKMNGTVVRRKP